MIKGLNKITLSKFLGGGIVSRKLTFLLAILMPISMLSTLSIFQGEAFAEISDGTYSIDYQVLHAENDSVSISNDYFEKPATLFIKDGKKHIQFTLNHSEWTKELQAPYGDSFIEVEVVSENKDEDTRVVGFNVEDLSKPLAFKMHALVESMEPVYDHRYTVRFDFDTDNMVEIEAADSDAAEPVTDKKNEMQEENPKMGGNESLVVSIVLLAVLALLIFKLRKRNITK